jgi:hypothetical protein
VIAPRDHEHDQEGHQEGAEDRPGFARDEAPAAAEDVDQGQDERRPPRRRDRLVAPPVAHVLDELDDEARVEGVAGDAHGGGEQYEDQPAPGLRRTRHETESRSGRSDSPWEPRPEGLK